MELQQIDLLSHVDSERRRDCVDKCLICHVVCLDFAVGLEGAQEREAVGLSTLLEDCAEISLMFAVSLLHREARINLALSTLCIEICERCAIECGRLFGGDEADPCIIACGSASTSCRNIVESWSLQ
jgi:hypothetical protein